MAQVAKKQFESLIKLVFKKKAGGDEEKTGSGKQAVPGRAISTLPSRRGGAPTPVLSMARRSAAVRIGRGGTARRGRPSGARESQLLGGAVRSKIF